MEAKSVSWVQLLAEMGAKPDDPRVIRVLELSVKKRERTIAEEEKKERLTILEALMHEAKAKQP